MSKFSKEDYIDYFNLATDSSGLYPDFEKMEKRLFGRWVAPDINQAIKIFKKKQNGAELFADYMIKQRPKGNIIMKPEKSNNTGPSGKKYESKLSSMIKRIIMEESSSWMEDGDVSDILIRDLNKELKQHYDGIKYCDKQIKSITKPSDNWAKKEYQSVIKSTQERIQQIKTQLQNIKEMDG